MLKHVFFPRKSFRLWDNVENIVKPGRPHMTIWRMRIACWVPKVTDTLGIYNTYCFSTTTVVTRTCINVTLNVHCLSCCYPFQCLNGSLKYCDGFLPRPCKFFSHKYPTISHLTLLNVSCTYSTIHVWLNNDKRIRFPVSFMVTPCINGYQTLYCSTNAHNVKT